MNIRRCLSKPGSRRIVAFMLVEAVLGMSLAATVIGALLSGITAGCFTMQMSRENLRATQILIEKMETIRLYSWNQIHTPNFIPAGFTARYDPLNSGGSGLTYTGTLSVASAPVSSSYAPDMRLVTVRLRWTTGNLERTRELSSYVSRHGLQDYIY